MELNGSQSESAKYYLPLSTFEPKQGSFEENEKVKSASKYLNMKETDPDWQFAHNHGCAARPGIAREGEMDDVCICCLRSINKDPIPLCENSKQLQFLGYGFPLYFTFIKYAMIILLIQIINYTAVQLFKTINYNHDICNSNASKLPDEQQQRVFCDGFMLLFSTIHQSVDIDEHLLRLSSFLTLLFAVVYLRDQFTKSWKYYDERRTSYSDFSVLIEKLPIKSFQGKSIGTRLREFFGDQTFFPDRPQITKINLIGESQVFWQIEEKINQKVAQRQKHQEKMSEIENQIGKSQQLWQVEDKLNQRVSLSLGQKNSSKMGEIDSKLQNEGGCFQKDEQTLKNALKVEKEKVKQRTEEIEQLEKEMKQQKERVNYLSEKEELDCHTAIVCFHSQDEAQYVRQCFDQLTKEQIQTKLMSRDVSFSQSPEPSQINWEFITVSSTSKIPKRILSWVLFIVLLATLTAAIFLLFKQKNHLVETQAHSSATLIMYCSIIIIILFNKFILAEAIHHLVDMEMPNTGTDFQFSFMIKYSLGLFFTTAIMTILVEGLAEQNVDKRKQEIVKEETLMFFFSTFFVPFIWLVNPWYLWRVYQRKKHLNTSYPTQEKANRLMEDPEYLMGKRYGELLEMSWFTYLYSCIIPFGSILIFLGFGLYYWVDKYNLLRRSAILQGISGDLCLKALFLLEFVLILKPGGELIFDKLIRNEWHVLPTIQLIVGGLYLLLPMNKILEYFNSQKFNATEISYQELKAKSYLSYQLYNPITRDFSLAKMFEHIKKSSEIDQRSGKENTLKLRLKRSHRGRKLIERDI